MAVGVGLRDRARRDGTVRTQPVLDVEVLSERLAELLRDGAGLDVGPAAGRKANDDADRTRWIILGLAARRGDGERNGREAK